MISQGSYKKTLLITLPTSSKLWLPYATLQQLCQATAAFFKPRTWVICPLLIHDHLDPWFCQWVWLKWLMWSCSRLRFGMTLVGIATGKWFVVVSCLSLATYHQTNKNSRPSKPKRPVRYYLGIVILDNKYFGKNLLLTNSATPYYLKTLSQDKGQQPNLPSTPHKAKLAELEENQSGSGSYLKVIEHFQPQNVIKLWLASKETAWYNMRHWPTCRQSLTENKHYTGNLIPITGF